MPDNPSVPRSADPGRVEMRASTSVRTENGVQFGTLVWVRGDRIALQLDHPLVPGSIIDVRVDLSPAPGTALVKAEVGPESARAPHEVSTFVLKVLSIADDDQRRWKVWLDTKQRGGTLSNTSDLRIGGGPLDLAYTPVASAERKAAVERMNARSHSSHSTSTHSSFTQSDLREAATGRAAVRDALKAAIRKASDAPLPASQVGQRPLSPPASTAPAAPSPPARRDSVPLVMPAQASSNPSTPARPPQPAARAAEPASPPPDPSWTAQTLAGRTYIDVRWASPEVFSYDVHSQLTACVIGLRAMPAPPGQAPPQLPKAPPIHALLRHASIFVQCEATPMDVGAESATYRLQLTAGQVTELRHFARPLSVEQSLLVEKSRRK